MGHVDVNAVSYSLPDGRPLLCEVSLRVGEGAKVALIGPNGTGKTSLLRIVSGDLASTDGAITRSGGLGVMRQFIGKVRDDTSVRDLLVSVAPEPIRRAAAAVETAELAMMERDDEPAQMAYAQALADWGDAGGYEHETLWDVCTVAALGIAVRAGPVARRPHAVRRRAEAAGPGGAAARPRGRAAAGRAGQLPRRADQALARGGADRLAQDGAVRQPRPRAAGPGRHPDRDAGADGRRVDALGAPGALLDLRPGPGRPELAAWRSCAAGGTRSTPSSRRSS